MTNTVYDMSGNDSQRIVDEEYAATNPNPGSLAKEVLALARPCQDHPMPLPKPSCPECARNGGITAAAHLVARGIE